MSEVRTTQAEKVLIHLQAGGKLTALQALKLYGINRLAARICALRKEGHDIKATTVDVATRTGTAKVARYFLELAPEPVFPFPSSLFDGEGRHS